MLTKSYTPFAVTARSAKKVGASLAAALVSCTSAIAPSAFQ